jgi:hypothetical protein
MKNFMRLSHLYKTIDVLFFLHIREDYILHQQKHAFNQPRCMYFSALPRTTPCVLDFLVFCYVDEGSAMYCYTKHQVYWKNQPLLHHNKTT